MISFLDRPKKDEEARHTNTLGAWQAEGTIRAKALRQKCAWYPKANPEAVCQE